MTQKKWEQENDQLRMGMEALKKKIQINIRGQPDFTQRSFRKNHVSSPYLVKLSNRNSPSRN